MCGDAQPAQDENAANGDGTGEDIEAADGVGEDAAEDTADHGRGVKDGDEVVGEVDVDADTFCVDGEVEERDKEAPVDNEEADDLESEGRIFPRF